MSPDNTETKDKQQLEAVKAISDNLLLQELTERYEENPEREVFQTVMTLAKVHQGPIPSPETLQEYENVKAGFADRIVVMAESEQKHRHTLEATDLKESSEIQKRGQNFAFGTLALAVLSGIIMTHMGATGGGLTIIALSVIIVFIKGRSTNLKEIIELIASYKNKKEDRK